MALWTGSAAAQLNLFGGEADEAKDWRENEVQMPAMPAPENLLVFDVGPAATQTHAVDSASVTVGSDGVTRYTLVSKSPAGAVNISHEGVRCRTFERKSYAYGRSDGSWSPSRRDQWLPITGLASNAPQAVLSRNFLCDGRASIQPKAVVQRLRYPESNRPL